MTDISIPETSEYVPLLSALIGKDLSVGPNEPASDPSSMAGFLHVFVDDDDKPVMLAGAEAPLAYNMGAALALIPKARAEDAAKSAEIDEDLYENYFEIMNVLTRVVNEAGGDHVRLVPGSTVDPDAIPAAASGRSCTIGVDGYGEGKLSFWLLGEAA